ncbi:MAG: UDP-N-acetylmuramate dehydrogenase [Oscillospiraceae bacterium]|jgi:UDP-N-acetylmuramate dehydrogenase|nr:UDP-N-acetylmuramate dehydrogenase [Oscillospiraceae bacterium]
MENRFQKLYQALENQGIPYAKDVPMSQKTTFRIGGPAALMVYPGDAAQVQSVLRLSAEAGESVFTLGRGSDLLVKDSGLECVVLSTERLTGFSVKGNTVTAGAGEKLSDLCLYAQQQGLAGLEFAFGIPGSVGGGVYMNAGAYGGELKDVCVSVKAVTADGESTLLAEDCAFGYRHSFFTDHPSYVVTEASFALSPDEPAAIRERMDAVMQKRKDKQPLEYPSAGSVFKRPPGFFAGGLIEQNNLKGKSIGGAQVSEKHAGFIVNKGGATAKDVRTLIALIQEVVQKNNGVLLEPEIKFI